MSVCLSVSQKSIKMPWPTWLSWLVIILQTEGPQVQFLVRAHAWVTGSVPGRVCMKGNQSMFLSHIDVSLPLFFPFLSLNPLSLPLSFSKQ